MYAIVDIETTGGNAQNSGITEVAIVLHNGREIEGRYETLINPQQPIPRYITALTGISADMLSDAPAFADVAPHIFSLLNGRVFVAHNVNFDYSFLYHHLKEAGIDWQSKKLCTVRYARKVFPGKKSYSLGNITRELGISIENRHRAGGDADATVQLFEQLLEHDDGHEQLNSFLKGRNAHSYLPMHLPVEQIDDLPYCAGVYYFHDQAGKIIYVGKAKNLKYRVRSHFTHNSPQQRRQDFIRQIYAVTYQACVSELHALLLEALEIKRLWPFFNRSLKRFEQLYGLYAIEDRQGMLRLAVEKKRKHLPALHSFHKLDEGYAIGRKLTDLFGMDAASVFAMGQSGLKADEIAAHNLKMKAAINHLKMHLPSFGIVESGYDEEGREVKFGYLIWKGVFAGMGFVDEISLASIDAFKNQMTAYHDFDFVRVMLHQHASYHPEAVFRWEPQEG